MNRRHFFGILGAAAVAPSLIAKIPASTIKKARDVRVRCVRASRPLGQWQMLNAGTSPIKSTVRQTVESLNPDTGKWEEIA